MRLRQLERYDPDLRLARRDQVRLDLDFVRGRTWLRKTRGARLLALPGVLYAGGAGFKETPDSSGLLIPAPANDPGETDAGYLAQPSRTFVAKNNETFASGWILDRGGTGVTPVLTPNYAQAPNGAMTAARLQCDRGAGTSGSDYSLLAQVVTGQTNTSYAPHVWVRSNTGATQIALMYCANQSIGKTFLVPPFWRKVGLSTTGTTTQPDIQIGTRSYQGSPQWFQGGDQTLDILVWRPDLEGGNTVSPTSSVAVGASNVTRTADNFQITGAGELLRPPFVFFQDLAIPAEDGQNIILSQVDAGSAADRLLLSRDTNNRVFLQSIIASVVSASDSTKTSKVNARHMKLALAVRPSGFQCAVDGVLMANLTGPRTVPINLVRLSLGSAAGIPGHPVTTRRATILDDMSDIQMAALTAHQRVLSVDFTQ